MSFIRKLASLRIVKFARKMVRLVLFDLFRELELTRLTQELVLAKLTNETFSRVNGIVEEIAYWQRSLLRSGGAGKTGKTQLTGFYLDVFNELRQKFAAEEISILDVGAGPLTNMGAYIGDTKLNLTAVDPLAPYYDVILKKYAIEPPVRTEFAAAEKLSERFQPELFHWVNANNSIDHTDNPVLAVQEMSKLVCKGGILTMRHHANEALNEQYRGFHQWNLYEKDGVFLICGRDRSKSVNVNNLMPPDSQVQCYTKDNDVYFIVRK